MSNAGVEIPAKKGKLLMQGSIVYAKKVTFNQPLGNYVSVFRRKADFIVVVKDYRNRIKVFLFDTARDDLSPSDSDSCSTYSLIDLKDDFKKCTNQFFSVFWSLFP